MSQEKVVLVTGAAGGIGAAIAEELLNAGFRLYLTDLAETRLEELSLKLKSRFGAKQILAKPLDVSSMDSVHQAAQWLEEAWGRLDVLVNNAGIFSVCPFLEMKEAEFERILNINLMGVFRVSQVFGRMMAAQNQGKIINIASLSAQKGASGSSHYAASKGGVLALAKTMALELVPYHIQVNTILPGYIETEMMGKHLNAMRKIATWRTPIKRLGQPQEVAEVVRFLASSHSPYLTGSEIILDGGHGIS